MNFKKITPVAVSLSALLAAGCSTFNRPHEQAFDDGTTKPQVPFVPAASTDYDPAQGTQYVQTFYADADMFSVKSTEKSDPLPEKFLSNISANESGVLDLLRLIALESGLSLSIEGGSKSLERYGAAATYNMSGSMQDILDQMSNAFGFFYVVKGNVLYIQQEQQFIVKMPPVLSQDNDAGITNTLQFLGAQDVYLDRVNRSLFFRTNKKAIKTIEAYMEKIREARAMLIYDISIFQVDLSDRENRGINWNAFNATNSAQAIETGIESGVNFLNSGQKAISSAKTAFGASALLSGSKFNVDLLVNFLQTQGTVRTISQPKLSIMNGSKGSLRVGQETTFVSKVGSNLSNSLNQTTVETTDLKTGFEVNVTGEEHDSTVYSRISLSITELLRFEKFTALGTDLTLPQTAARELTTEVRARPGDTILMAGITTNRQANEGDRGVTGNNRVIEKTVSELVIAITPRVIKFTNDPKMLEKNDPAFAAEQAKKIEASGADKYFLVKRKAAN